MYVYAFVESTGSTTSYGTMKLLQENCGVLHKKYYCCLCPHVHIHNTNPPSLDNMQFYCDLNEKFR